MVEEKMTPRLAIERINVFVPYKTWRQGSNLSGVVFKTINLGYGKNGAGKSSLAKILSDVYDGDSQNVRLYDKNYVDRVLLIEDQTGINGVVSHFGERDVALEQKIHTFEKENKRINDEYRKNREKYSNAQQSIKLALEEIFERRKGSNSRIKNKPTSKTPREIYDLWIDDYNKAVKQFPDEDFAAVTGDKDYTGDYDEVNNAIIPEWDTGLESTETLCEAFRETFQNLDVPSSTIIEWLEKGIVIHEHEHRCQFCDSQLDLPAIKEKVSLYKKDKKHQGETIIAEYRDKLIAIKRNIDDFVANQDICKLLAIDDATADAVRNSSVTIERILREYFIKKLDNMSRGLNIQEDIRQCLDSLEKNLNLISACKSRKSDEIQKKINKLEMLLKGAIGYEIQNSLVISKALAEIDKLAKEESDLKDEQRLNQQEINKLKAQKSDLSDFAVYLNVILSEMSVDFHLEVENKYYVLKHSDGQHITVADISEGEKNLLALIYFYFEMLENDSGKLKEEIKLVIIDDPSSSLDSENYFYITELMKELMREKTIQLFILTHHWPGYCDLAYGTSKNDNVNCFEIIKKDRTSNIVCLPKGTAEPPYKRLYKEVNDFAEIVPEDVSSEQSIHMPNTIRRVLEEYIKFKLNVDFATAAKSGDISKALFSKEIAELSNTEKQKLSLLLDVCNVLSHKANNHPKEPKEIHNAARTLIRAIKNNDKYHHLKMIE